MAVQELIEHYAAGYERLTKALEAVSDELLQFKPAPERWSIHEVVVHVADAEMVAIHRMKKVIAEENPLLFKFDPDAWANRLAYTRQELELHLELFRLQRVGMVAVLKNLQPEDWSRTGVHNVTGKQTLEDLVQMFARHVDQHVDQIERNKKAFHERA